MKLGSFPCLGLAMRLRSLLGEMSLPGLKSAEPASLFFLCNHISFESEKSIKGGLINPTLVPNPGRKLASSLLMNCSSPPMS